MCVMSIERTGCRFEAFPLFSQRFDLHLNPYFVAIFYIHLYLYLYIYIYIQNWIDWIESGINYRFNQRWFCWFDGLMLVIQIQEKSWTSSGYSRIPIDIWNFIHFFFWWGYHKESYGEFQLVPRMVSMRASEIPPIPLLLFFCYRPLLLLLSFRLLFKWFYYFLFFSSSSSSSPFWLFRAGLLWSIQLKRTGSAPSLSLCFSPSLSLFPAVYPLPPD